MTRAARNRRNIVPRPANRLAHLTMIVLTFGSQQKSSALKDYFVRCSCGEFAGLGGASEAKNFNEMKLECTGREPWIFLNPENTESPPFPPFDKDVPLPAVPPPD